MSSFREAAVKLFGILDRLGIVYAAGGSFASPVHGVARDTQDLDLVVDFPAGRVEEFHAAVSKEFYAGEQATHEAIRLGRSFHLIHFASGFKFDPFAASGHPMAASSWRTAAGRRRRTLAEIRSMWQLSQRRTSCWQSCSGIAKG